jgi:pimeloyl-ACP methyl ester carboxylesterase
MKRILRVSAPLRGTHLPLLALVSGLLLFSTLGCERSVSAYDESFASEDVLTSARHITPSAEGCTAGVQSSGALYEICLPEGGSTDGTLAIYAHGFVFPQSPLVLPAVEAGVNVRELLTGQGYAYAATSYYTNGLVRPELGVKDLRELIALYTRQHGRPERVILFGVSNGALIGTIALEKHPQLFDGAFLACAPAGNFRQQVNYLGDLLVLFQHYFPGVVAGGPDGIPHSYLGNLIAAATAAGVAPDAYLGGVLVQVMTSDANLPRTFQLLSVMRNTPEIDARYASFTEGLHTVIRGVVYNVFAANNAADMLGGASYDNRNRQYIGSADDAALNTAIARYNADTRAVAQIEAHYQTRGRLTIPVVSLHTERDPTVPFWHTDLYRAKLGSSAPLHTLTPIDRFGHCTFTAGEVAGAMAALGGSMPLVAAN